MRAPGVGRGIILLFTLCCSAAGCSREKGPLRIGLAGPLTSPVGAPMRLAARMAVEEINRTGGVQGRPLALIERDDFDSQDSAVKVAANLYRTDVVAVIGHVSSGTTLAAAPVYNGGATPVVEIAPSASSPELTGAGDYTFRLSPSDAKHGATLAEWALGRLRTARAAVFYLNNDYGRGVREAFTEKYTALGGEVLMTSPYLDSPLVVGPYLDRLVADGRANLLVIAGNRTDAVEIIRRVRARRLTLPVVGGDGLEGIEADGPAAEGVFLTAAYLPDEDSPKAREFLTAWKRRYPAAGNPNQPAAATYDAVYLLRQVLETGGPRRGAVRDGIARLGNATPGFEGVTGTIRFDPRGDRVDAHLVVGRVRNGHVEPAERP